MNCFCFGQDKSLYDLQYEFKYYDDDAKKSFLHKHNKQITQILVNAFYSNIDGVNPDHIMFTDDDLEKSLEGTLFVCQIRSNSQKKVIGICSARSHNFLKHNIHDTIEPYNTLRYIHIPNNIISDFIENKDKYNTNPIIHGHSCDFSIIDINSSIYIYDKHLNHLIHMSCITLPVIIDSLAKDKTYKNVGKFLIDNVAKYYKSKGFTTIYLGAESATYRHNLISYQIEMFKKYENNENNKNNENNENENIENFKKTASLYKNNQTSLCKYYESYGFKLIPDVYYVHKLLTSESGITSINFYKFYKLKI